MEENEEKRQSLAEMMAEMQMQEVIHILTVVKMERAGLLELPFTSKSGENAIIYLMAQLFLEHLDAHKTEGKRKEEELQKLEDRKQMEIAKKEIEILYKESFSLWRRVYRPKCTDLDIVRQRL